MGEKGHPKRAGVKRKRDEVPAPPPGFVFDDDADGGGLKKFLCTLCHSRYQTLQGARHHHRDVHAAPRYGPDTTQSPAQHGRTTSPSFSCRHCDRVFRTRVDLEAHENASHTGKFTSIKPDWFTLPTMEKRAQIAHLPAREAGSVTLDHACGVCGLCFATATELAHHGKQLRPPSPVSFKCENCSKTFNEARALKQHANTCASRSR